MDKPGIWFLLAKLFENHLWKSDILSKDAGPPVCFKHFASKNQLPGFYINQTLVENEGHTWPLSVLVLISAFLFIISFCLY